MADNLPLIPEKSGAVCTDVRPVLREVFKELDFLPPLAPERKTKLPGEDEDNDPVLRGVNQWVKKYESDRKEIWNREGELKQKHAQRIAREPLPNIYKLYPPAKKRDKPPLWKTEHGLIERTDLIPSIVQNSGLKESLWIKNILNRSSCNLTSMVLKETRMSSLVLGSPKKSTLQSISIGELVSHTSESLPSAPPPPRPPEYILCVPPQLDFINFTVGNLHTQGIRLVNVSKFEVRLSIRPPYRKELDIELAGSRGLTVTSGAAAELRVHFRPLDVRVLRDVLLVRVSTGQSLSVPISCYMQPPILDILVPAVFSSTFSCTPGCTEAVACSSDCLELGARLLGDVHCVPILIYCEAEHASFFLLTEDAWLSFSLGALTSRGSVVAEPFILSPAWWQGGGSVRGQVWCRAPAPGLHSTALRVVCSTAVVRPLNLLADALYFRPDHITLKAHEKDYDICCDDDPACEYYVHLGTAFPHRSLRATVQLVNHSPVIYSYYWSVRPWGECSCWEEQAAEFNDNSDVDSDTLCVGAKEARDKETKAGGGGSRSVALSYVRVEPARGAVSPRGGRPLHVCAPDVGTALGVQRAVLMLILKGIPKESIPAAYHQLIIKTEVVESDPIPGVKRWSREVCEVVCTQMEVWWEVAPVRFVLEPSIMHLNYSRRVNTVDVIIRATQLFGSEGISCSWKVPDHVPQPPSVILAAVHSCENTLKYPLTELPNEYPETDVLTLEAAKAEWQSQCLVKRSCATRHPALRPARTWLGVVPPGERMFASLEILNDTYQHICWWGSPFRCVGESPPHAACDERACPGCYQPACTCGLLRPARGGLAPGDTAALAYSVVAPLTDGCVATLVRVGRTSPDTARAARGALLAARVLAPRAHLRVLPCGGEHCDRCAVDEGSRVSGRGAATLRPRGPLAVSRRTCYRLRVTNVTPLPTVVEWDPTLEEDVLKVIFMPNEFTVGPYAQVDIRVVLEARKVCGRRLFVYCAQVKHAYKPLYLVIDAAISGLEVTFELPLGGAEKTESTLVMRRTQKEIFPWNEGEVEPSTPQEMFEEEDRKREKRAENTCRCPYELVYIAPVKRPHAPSRDDDDYPPVEIVWEPPPLTRVCHCYGYKRPILPEYKEALCLQFEQLPLRTVRSRVVTIKNESVLSATWSAYIRKWPRRRTRTLNEDQWSSDVRSAGVCLSCEPSGGALAAGGRARLTLAVYADCWGLYHDQLLVKVDHLEPLVLDVWVEAVGAPLQFAISGADRSHAAPTPALCWMSASDPVRTLRVKNVSRAELAVSTFTVTEHEHTQDALPFRLYLRLYDVPPPTCPCTSLSNSVTEFTSVMSSLAMDTGVELCLAADHGLQDHSHYKVFPDVATIPSGQWFTWTVTLVAPPHGELPPPSALLLLPRPLTDRGDGWSRPVPAGQAARLRAAPRAARLWLSCCELRAAFCALDLPCNDVIRIRKRFRVQNTGSGPLDVSARTEEPWSILTRQGGARETQVSLHLMPRSSVEMCVEATVSAAVCPAAPLYAPRSVTTTHMCFYEDDNVLETLPLILELEFPIITIEPDCIDFGFVADGDVKQSYFTVLHSSRTESLDLVAEWVGGEEFKLWPTAFTLLPGRRETIYVQYTARWCGGPVAGCARVSARAGRWCRALGAARAAPLRAR